MNGTQVLIPVEIPAHDLVAQYELIHEEVDAAIKAVLASGEFERGEELWSFEEEFAQACGAAHGIGVGTGHAALFIALRALGIGPGDEVITVANTDISTCSAIGQCGARIVFADVDEATFNADPAAVEAAITPSTAAIVAVHLYGLPADVVGLGDLARRHGLALIEDAALAFGSAVDGRPVGGLGQVGCFSFAPHKILGAYGDGGMITTNDDQLARRARLLAGYGEPWRESMTGPDGRLTILAEGYHTHLDLLQAAVLRVKLRHVEQWIEQRRAHAALYDELLVDSAVVTPAVPHGRTHVYRSYVVRVQARDAVRAELGRAGIETALLYVPPLHRQPVYEGLGYAAGSLPVTEATAGDLLCLPVYPELSEGAVRRVAGELRRAAERPRSSEGEAT
jgi:dTDP-4-amino-4,6-dideoxygalactose transaminase